MNIEYEITIEDDLDTIFTDLKLWLKEKFLFICARYFPLSIFAISIGYIVWSYFTIEQSGRYALFTCGILCLFNGETELNNRRHLSVNE